MVGSLQCMRRNALFAIYVLTADDTMKVDFFLCVLDVPPTASQVWTVIDTSFCCLRVGTQDLQPNGQKEKKNFDACRHFVKKKNSAQTNAIFKSFCNNLDDNVNVEIIHFQPYETFRKYAL